MTRAQHLTICGPYRAARRSSDLGRVAMAWLAIAAGAGLLALVGAAIRWGR